MYIYMVDFENLLETPSMEIQPFGPASDKPLDSFGFCGRLHFFGKVARST